MKGMQVSSHVSCQIVQIGRFSRTPVGLDSFPLARVIRLFKNSGVLGGFHSSRVREFLH